MCSTGPRAPSCARTSATRTRCRPMTCSTRSSSGWSSARSRSRRSSPPDSIARRSSRSSACCISPSTSAARPHPASRSRSRISAATAAIRSPTRSAIRARRWIPLRSSASRRRRPDACTSATHAPPCSTGCSPDNAAVSGGATARSKSRVRSGTASSYDGGSGDSLFGDRRYKFSNRCLQLLCAAEEVGEQLVVDIHAAFVLRQVSFAVSLEEDLYVGVICTEGVNERLKNGDPVLGSISLVSKGGERQPVCGTIGEVKPAVGLYSFVLRVGQASAGRGKHAVKRLSRAWLDFELPNLYEVVELLLAHELRSFSEPIIKIFGELLIWLTTDPLSDALRCQSLNERNIGLTFRRSSSSALCAAV